MAVSYGKGDKGKATKLHAEITRMYGQCENCGKTSDQAQLQCAHIQGRKASATRTALYNAFCLCAGCHFFFTDHPLHFSRFVTTTWAQDFREQLLSAANTMTKMNWSTRVEFLKEMKQLIASGDYTVDDARREDYKRTYEA
jgi:hypothetical protein